MTIQLINACFIGGSLAAAGSQHTLDQATEEGLIYQGMATRVGAAPLFEGAERSPERVYKNPTTGNVERWDSATTNYVGVGGRGEIALYGAETWNGSAFSGSGCVVPSSVFSGTSLGTTVAWNGTGGPSGSIDGVLFDTTAGGVFDPLQPERITIPSGVTLANFTGSVSWPATALGERWIRLVLGASTHISSVVFPATTTPTIQNMQINTGWIPVTAGEYYTLHAVQNSGSSITLAAGNYSNKGGSTFFRAAFK